MLDRLDSAISIAKVKKFEKIQQLENIYNADIDTTNESVLSLEKSFSSNYNPNSNLQQVVVESLNQETYSPSIAAGQVEQLSVAITEEINNLEKSAVELLNEIYKGVTVAKEVLAALKNTGTYPKTWDEQYIRGRLQSCSFLAKALKIKNEGQESNSNPQPSNDDGVAVDAITDVSAEQQLVAEDQGCGEIFRKTEQKIMKQLVIAIKEIKSMQDAKRIDSKTSTIFKNYSIILSNLNQKIIKNVITVVNQFFQLYHIVLSILDKINPDMKAKAVELLYMTDVDTSDVNYQNINKFIVEEYLSSSKMKEFYDRIDNHVKSMKSLNEIKKGIVQELSVTTSELGQDLQTMKDTVFYIFEEIEKGVTALQNIKNKSNRTGFRYYLNFYRGKADLKQLRTLMYVINGLNIELLLERQLLNDEDEMKDFELATSTARSEIEQENEKLLNELNSMSDFSFVRGFVSKSVLEYNMLLESYSVESRKTMKKVITKYITIFEEIIITIKRKKIKNAESIENLFNNDETVPHDEVVSKYLLEHTNVVVETLCSTLNQENVNETKETAAEEIRELNEVTRTEVSKINKKVKSIINTISTQIKNLKSTKEQVSQNVEVELSNEQTQCITNIVQLINSLQIKSSKDEIQSLSIFFERVKETIQIAIQTFETQTTECNDFQQFKSQIETLKTSIYDSLTKASFEIKDKIRRVIFEYNEKLYVLQKNTKYGEWNLLQIEEESSFTLNENTRKYITGCYTSEEVFKNMNDVIGADAETDINQLKTDLSTQLDETNQQIESELNAIHEELNHFVQKFAEGMKVVTLIEEKTQKSEQAESVVGQAEWDKLREVNEMVRVISKNVNIIAENSVRELKVQIDNARHQISKQCEHVSQTVAALEDNAEIENTIAESISSCDKIYNELKNNTKLEINHNMVEFLQTYEKITVALRTRSTETSTVLQSLYEENYKTEEDEKYQKFVYLMHQQDYESTTTVTDSFEYLKKCNFVDSQTMKEKSTSVFQSLSNKMNLEIDNISYVSKYMLGSVQKANQVLIQLENSEKQSTTVSLNEEELNELRKAKSIAESWKYSLEDNTIGSISSTINSAKNEMDIQYKQLEAKIESSSDKNSIQTEVESGVQKIESIFKNTQITVNEKIQQSTSNFYNAMSNYITEFQSSGSETLNSSLESILNGRNAGKVKKGQGVSMDVDFDIFARSMNVREIYNEIETNCTQKSSNSSKISNVEELRRVMNSNVESLEKTSTYVVESIQKGFSIMTEIQSVLQQDSNYQLTKYQEEQLRKCITVYRRIENLNVSAKVAEERINSSIDLVRNQISQEYTKVSELIATLSDEKAVEETLVLGVKKFEQLFGQAKETVKEQLSLTSSNFYNSFTSVSTCLEEKDSREITKVMLDIKNGNTAYEMNSDQSFVDTTISYFGGDQSFLETISYFNSKSFKSCVTIKTWFSDIRSSTCAESYSSANERGTGELSSLNEQITTSLDKMQSSSTYVLESIEQSTEMLKQMEKQMKENTLSELTQEQITELQRCMTIYKSIQVVTSSTTSTTLAQENIHTDISNVKSEINSAYSEITQSISALTEDSLVEETALDGVKTFEQLFSKAKETVKEQLSQTLTSFYTSLTQISTDLQTETQSEVYVVLQEIKSSSCQSENDQSFVETLSYFTSSSFKSCITIKNWFSEVRSSSSSSTFNSFSEKSVSDLNTVNERISGSLEEMENHSTYVLESIQKSAEILKQIERSATQSTKLQLSQEQINELKSCTSMYHNIQSTISTSTSTTLAQQIIQTDINDAKEEFSSFYSRITESISSTTEESTINEKVTKGVEKYEQLFSQVKSTVKEQLLRISSSFFNSYTQISSDMQQQSNQQIQTETTYQSETDETFRNMMSCFKSNIFTSNTTITTLYQEIHTSTSETESSYLSERVVSEFATLNDRVTQSIESMQENSAYVLETIKKGSEVLKQLEESTIQESTFELTEEQRIYLQKCTTMYQTIQTIQTSSSTNVSEAKQTITNDIQNIKSQMNNEFTKVSETINSLSDESSIQLAANESVNTVSEFFGQTKEKVQSQLKLSSSNFYNDLREISSGLETHGSQMSTTLKDIENGKSAVQSSNDQSYDSAVSYLKSDCFTSSNIIQSWYEEIQSSWSNTESSCNERSISELSSLNERVIESFNSMEQSSTRILDTFKKGSEILTQMKQSSANTNYQLSQEQIISLQKCVTIYESIQSISTTSSSTNISEVKQTISSDISNVKSQINDELTKTSESIRSLIDENTIKEAATQSVNNVDSYFSQTVEKVQSQLTETSSTFYQKISSYLDKQKNVEICSVLQEVVNSNEVYQAESDHSFSNVLSYFSSDVYQSSNVVQTWYSDIQATATESGSSVNESTINQLSVLNERVTESVNSMDENSTYVLDTIEKGTEILQKVDKSSSDSGFHLSQEEVTYLQKCMAIYQTISSTTMTSSTSISETKQTISTDISNAKNQITEEFTKVSQEVSSLTDEKSIQEVVNKNVAKVDEYYSQTQEKVQTQLTQTSDTFFTTCKQISSESATQKSEVTNILEDIMLGKNTYQSSSDESFTRVLSYFRSDSYKTSSVIQNWYSEIHSSSTTSSSLNESVTNELSALNERVIKSVDQMEESSTYVLDAIERGSEILKQVQQSCTQESSYQLSEEQIIDLQKCVTIYQTIQTTTSSTSKSVSEVKQTINSDIFNVKNQINDEFDKVSESIRSLSDESSIKQAVDGNVDKVQQYYSETQEKVNTELTYVSTDFFSNYQQITSVVEKQEITNVLQDIMSGKNTYQSDNDETYTNVVSYLNSDIFRSNESVRNVYHEIQSSTTTSESSYSAETAVTELGTLNDRVTKSIDTMDENSAYILDTIEKGLEVLKQVEEQTKQNSEYEMTSEQIINLQKCITIYQSIQSTTTSSSTTVSAKEGNVTGAVECAEKVSQAEQTISSDVGTVKTQINNEYVKMTDSVRSLTDKSNIEQTMDENVRKVDRYYSEVQGKVQSQLMQTSSSFFNTFQQISSDLETQDNSEVKKVLQEIINTENGQFEDESFTKVESYLNSEAFKSNTIVELYENIQSSSSTSESTDYAEQAVTTLSTLNEKTTRSVDTMEENSKYVLSTIKRGSEVLKVVEESTKQGSKCQLTKDQIINLQKCIAIYRIIESGSSVSGSGSKGTIADEENYQNDNIESSSNDERSITEEVPTDSSNEVTTVTTGNTKDATVNDTMTFSDTQQSGNVNGSTNAETDTITVALEAEQKITTDVQNVKCQINDEFVEVSKSISSSSDETIIQKAVEENVSKVDQYYKQAIENVHSQLTQTSIGFFSSFEEISTNVNQQATGAVLQDIMNSKNTYQPDDDEEFLNMVTYLNSESFQITEIQNWYKEIQSSSVTSDINLGERSVNELSTLNDRVATSVDTMEERSRYILETIKKGAEVLKQVEEATMQDSTYELTQEQITELQKCITIYQTIQSVTTASTTTSNTTEVSNDSVTNESTFSDDEYEYVVNVTKNTKQIVEVEEVSQEENEISVIQKEQMSKNVGEDVTNSNSSLQNSISTSEAFVSEENQESDLENAISSIAASDSMTNESETREPGTVTSQDVSSLDADVDVEEQNLNNNLVTQTNDMENSDFNLENEIPSVNASDSTNTESGVGETEISDSPKGIHSVETHSNAESDDVLSEFDVSSNKTNNAVSPKSSNSSMKRTSHSSKVNLLKKFNQAPNTYPKTSLNSLMVNKYIN